jgi:predicted esterase
MLELVLSSVTGEARADRFLLRDNRVLEGRMEKRSSLAKVPRIAPAAGVPEPWLIFLIDDELRRTSVPKVRVQEALGQDTGMSLDGFIVEQPVARLGGKVAQVPAVLSFGPWDQWGRRTVALPNGVDVVQGITQITPRWTKVEALEQAAEKNLVWEMRIATSLIPPETLRVILRNQIDAKKIEDRLRLVRLFLQCERFDDCTLELEQVVRDFPANGKQLAPVLHELELADFRRRLADIILRRQAGQYQFADQWLLQWRNQLGAAGVAGESLKAVEQTIERSRIENEQYTELIKRLGVDAAALAGNNPVLGQRLMPIVNEIKSEMTINSLARMAAYQQLANNPNIEENAALAVSSWLVGPNDAVRKLPVALSLLETRDLVRRYLAEPVNAQREQIVVEMKALQGATPEVVAKLLAYMRPPLQVTEPTKELPAFFELKVDGLAGESPVKYCVQLPPEYDPHRLYPTLVTLHGEGATPQSQIDWWAGEKTAEGQRLGHATRYGYIVLAPAWANEGQTAYTFSAAEQAAVLNTLRDACRHFSIDTDKVFLSGHSMGGDAAWDVGIAHPDLWAGVVPIVARSERYILRLWENARYLNLYFVGGELDADNSDKNSKDLDRYMTRGYNATVVEFHGRGHEDFSDEIPRLFDWMNRYARNFHPKEFRCHCMRTWEKNFWWLDLDELPSKTIIEPKNWPPPRGLRPASTTATAVNNDLAVKTAAGKLTFWLSPGIIDFKLRATITVNNTKAKLKNGFVTPALNVMLEDARTRGDRQHPFWAKVTVPGP